MSGEKRGAGSDEKERAWVRVQVKAFTSWVNSYLSRKSHRIDDLVADLHDGTKLCYFIDIVENNRTKFDKWMEKPTRKIQMLQNLDMALRYITTRFGVRLVGIGPEDIFDGKLKLILGVLWSLFRKLRMSGIGADKSGRQMEEALLDWVKATVGHYDGVEITDFARSFKDGKALAALVHAYDNGLLNYDQVSKLDASDVFDTAFSVAEEKMNIPKLLEKETVMSGEADERSVMMYVSLYYHAFAMKKEEADLEAQRMAMATDLADMQVEVENLTEQYERMKREIAEFAEMEAQMRQKMADDLAEAERLRKMIADSEAALAAAQPVLSDAERLAALEAELLSVEEELNRKREQALRDDLTPAERAALLEEIRALEARAAALRAQIAEATKAVGEAGGDTGGAEVEEWYSVTADMDALRGQALHVNLALQRHMAVEAQLAASADAVARQASEQQSSERLWKVFCDGIQNHLEDLQALWSIGENGGDFAQEFPAAAVRVPDLTAQQVLANVIDRVEGINDSLFKGQAEEVLRIPSLLVLRQGPLTRVVDGAEKQLHAVLHGDRLTLHPAAGKASTAVCTLEGGEVEVADATVTLRGRKDTWTLQAASDSAARQWAAQLRGAARLSTLWKEAQASSSWPDARVVHALVAPSLPELWLSGEEVDAEDLNQLLAAAALRDELRVLKLRDCGLKEAHVDVLAAHLPTMGALEVLDVGQNDGLQAAGAKVVKALASCTHLQELYCDGNIVAEDQVGAFSSAIGGMTRLAVLNVQGCDLGEEGATSLVAALTGKPLACLVVSRNDLGAGGLGALTPLASQSPLSELNVAANDANDAGVVALCAGVRDNAGMRTVLIGENEVGAAALGELCNTVMHGKEMQSVSLAGSVVENVGDAVALFNFDAFYFQGLQLQRRAAA